MTVEPLEGADAYEVLGVSPDVSPLVAQAVYWARVAELRRDEDGGNAAASERIGELSVALARILDRYTAGYDSHGRARGESAGAGGSPDAAIVSDSRYGTRPKRLRRGALVLALGGSAALALIAVQASALLATTSVLAPLALYAWLTRARRSRPGAFTILELSADSKQDAIDIAYRALVSAQLSRLHAAPEDAVANLDELDWAYASAIQKRLTPRRRQRVASAAMLVAWAAMHSARSLSSRALRATYLLGRFALRAAGAIARSLARLIVWSAWQVSDRLAHRRGILARSLTRIATLVSDSVVSVQRRTASRVAAKRPRESAELPATPSESHVSVRRRLADVGKPAAKPQELLAASVEAVAEHAQHPTPAAPRSRDSRFVLALESAVGTRLVSIEDGPLRIGGGANADVVVDQSLLGDEERGDILIWKSGEELVLHASGNAMGCSVNDSPVTWAKLDEGDTVQVANLRLRVRGAVPIRDDLAA